MLTQEQLNHFEVFGFLVWKQAFSPDEIAGISDQFDSALSDDRQGRDFPGDKRSRNFSGIAL